MKKRIKADTFLHFQYVSNPTFSPDGSKICFVVQKADLENNGYQGNLWILDRETRRVCQLTSGGDGSDYVFTPSGTLLFQTKRTKEEKEKEDAAVFYEIDPAGGEARPAFTLPIQRTGIHGRTSRTDLPLSPVDPGAEGHHRALV